MTQLANVWVRPLHYLCLEGETVLVLRDAHDQPWAWITSSNGYHRLEIWDGLWRIHGVFADLETAKVIGRIAASASMTTTGV